MLCWFFGIAIIVVCSFWWLLAVRLPACLVFDCAKIRHWFLADSVPVPAQLAAGNIFKLFEGVGSYIGATFPKAFCVWFEGWAHQNQWSGTTPVCIVTHALWDMLCQRGLRSVTQSNIYLHPYRGNIHFGCGIDKHQDLAVKQHNYQIITTNATYCEEDWPFELISYTFWQPHLIHWAHSFPSTTE